MSGKNVKCLAMTLKPANSKRAVEEISRCTRYALENSRFCGNHKNLHELTDEQFENNTKICRQCKKHKYFSDMSYKLCDDDRDIGVEKRARYRAERVVYQPCMICGFTGGNERKYPNYCNKHLTDGYKADIEQHGLKWCKGIIRGCPNPELPQDYPYEKCEVCRHKENLQDQKRSQTKLEESFKQVKDTMKCVKKIQIQIKDVREEIPNKTEPDLSQTQENAPPRCPKKIQITVKSKPDEVICDSVTEKQSLSVLHDKDSLRCVSKLTTKSDFEHIYLIEGNFYKICSSPKHHCLHPLEEFF